MLTCGILVVELGIETKVEPSLCSGTMLCMLEVPPSLTVSEMMVVAGDVTFGSEIKAELFSLDLGTVLRVLKGLELAVELGERLEPYSSSVELTELRVALLLSGDSGAKAVGTVMVLLVVVWLTVTSRPTLIFGVNVPVEVWLTDGVSTNCRVSF